MINNKESILQNVSYLDERPLKQVVLMIIFTFVLGIAATYIVNYLTPCPASAVCPPGYKKVQGVGIVICKKC